MQSAHCNVGQLHQCSQCSPSHEAQVLAALSAAECEMDGGACKHARPLTCRHVTNVGRAPVTNCASVWHKLACVERCMADFCVMLAQSRTDILQSTTESALSTNVLQRTHNHCCSTAKSGYVRRVLCHRACHAGQMSSWHAAPQPLQHAAEPNRAKLASQLSCTRLNALI